MCACLTGAQKLLRLDLSDKSLHLDSSRISLGFAADKAIRELKQLKRVSDRDVLAIRLDTKNLIITLVEKFLHKSPIHHTLVRRMDWLQPKKLISTDVRQKERCRTHVKSCLHLMEEAHRISTDQCDLVAAQFDRFVPEAAMDEAFQSFDLQKSRLDVLYYDALSEKAEFSDLWSFVKKLLLLSHGQATVERGFSQNKDTMVVNLAEETLVAKRVIKDHLHHVGGIFKVKVTQQLLTSARGAHRRYQQHLEEERAKARRPAAQKRRAAALGELDELKAKRKRFESLVKSLSQEADKLAEEAEAKGRIALLSQSNALRKSSKEKEQQVSSLTAEIEKKEAEFKSLS